MDRGYSWNVHDLQRSENGIASPLYYAALLGLESTLESLISIGGGELSMVDIANAADGEHHSALEAASWNGHVKVVRMLLEAGAHEHLDNALYAASERGDEQKAQILLNQGANFENCLSRTYGSAFNAALSYGHERIVQLAMDRGVDATVQSTSFFSPLQFASRGGNLKVVQMTLDQGANVNARSLFNSTALIAAAMLGQVVPVDCEVLHQLY